MPRSLRFGKTYVVMPESSYKATERDVEARRAIAFIVHRDKATNEEILELLEKVNDGIEAAREGASNDE